MPYKTIKELPEQVKVLPSAAQRLFMRVFNSASKDEDEETAMKMAWSQVKKTYEKADGKWKKKSVDNSELSHVVLADSDGDTVQLKDKRFKKQVLRVGKWLYDNATSGGPGVFEVTKEKAKELVENFKNRVIENVPVTRGHVRQSEMDKNPNLVAGYVEDLELDDDKVYAVFKTEDDDADEEIGKKYKNVSLSIDENYEDHESGQDKGFVARHLALTVEPYIKKLDPKFVALSDELDKPVVNISLEENMAEEKKKEKEAPKEEAAQKVEKEAEAPEEKKEVAEKAEAPEETAVAEKDEEEAAPEPKPQDEEKEEEEVTEGSEKDLSDTETESEEQAEPEAAEEDDDVTELSEQLRTKDAELAELREKEVETQYKKLLSEGRVLPAQKEEAMALLKNSESVELAEGESTKVSELFKSFIEKSTPQVDMSEKGVSTSKTKKDSDTPDSVLFRDKKIRDKYLNLYK